MAYIVNRCLESVPHGSPAQDLAILFLLRLRRTRHILKAYKSIAQVLVGGLTANYLYMVDDSIGSEDLAQHFLRGENGQIAHE